jgi:PPOX class probable FMN-dependent enzyme
VSYLRSVEELEAIYGLPRETALVKETAHVTPHYRAYIEASPFCVLATSGPEGLDCSPRGDLPGFVRVADETTLMMPDRKGNNRADSLKNILRDPRVALLFLLPGHGNCIRVNGEAAISIDADLKASFAVEGHEPRSVIVIRTRAVYFQCARAIVRSGLWSPQSHVDAAKLPTTGEMLAALSGGSAGGPDYDRQWENRAQESLW